jgi:teichuronic acid biosynthesis glycosyltransferase TuaC
MQVLTFTSLFPNSANPAHGLFVYQRMSHFACRPGNHVIAVAPVPYFPRWFRPSKRHASSLAPKEERIGDLTIYHPRYPLLPAVSMPLHGWLMLLGTFLLVRRLHQQNRFDCIDAHYVYPDGFAAVLLGKLLGLPVIVSARGTDINLFPSFRLIRPMIRWTLRNVAGAVAVSTGLQDAMLRLGLPRDSVQVIGNGVDLERFSSVDRAAARNHLGLPQDAQIVVSVGGLVEAKGHHHLILSLAAILPRHPKLRAYIIGEGPSRSKLESLIRARGLQNHVVLQGSQANEQLRFWYSSANLSCLTSSREGWPNVILESMACGTPVLATGVGGVPEVIASPDVGLIVDQSVHSIASGLETALTKAWDRTAIERYARQRTWDKVAAELEQWFNSRLNLASNSGTSLQQLDRSKGPQIGCG